ncbi:MAG: hypothetical protein PW788_06945 [Micavibrio sp.]|nr:hypothetical protein [Micavibrio sp.]
MASGTAAKIIFALGAGYGLALWALSVPLFGTAEPWDGAVLVYFALLVLGGLVLGYYGQGSAWMVYASIYIGQFVIGFCRMLAGENNLFSLGAILLFAFTLPAFAGGKLGGALARLKALQKATK